MWDIATRIFAGVAMIGLAIGLGCAIRRIHASWKTFGWGALCFISSQVAHIPFNLLVVNPIFAAMGWNLATAQYGGTLLFMSFIMGLSAGIFEETARWIFYRSLLFRRQETILKSYEFALMFGAGHGGCEAIIAGFLAITTLITMTYLRTHPEAMDAMPKETQKVLQKALTDYWASSNLLVLMAPVERVFAMSFHLSASVLIWQGFAQPNNNNMCKYWCLAVAFHTALDTAAVFLLIAFGAYAVEGCLLLTAFPLSLYILWCYRPVVDTTNGDLSSQEGLFLSPDEEIPAFDNQGPEE